MITKSALRNSALSIFHCKFRFDRLFAKQPVILSEQSESKDLVICGDRKMVDPSAPLRFGRDDSIV